MTETGSTVERLRGELERVEAAPYVTVLRVERDDLRALLAVVEAAQDYIDGWDSLKRTPPKGKATWTVWQEPLREALAALHSQASDEGRE